MTKSCCSGEIRARLNLVAGGFGDGLIRICTGIIPSLNSSLAQSLPSCNQAGASQMKRPRGVFPAQMMQGESQRCEPRAGRCRRPHTHPPPGHCHLLQPFPEGKLRQGPQRALRLRFLLSSCVVTRDQFLQRIKLAGFGHVPTRCPSQHQPWRHLEAGGH